MISFSKRCFPTKTIALWHTLDDTGRVALVKQLLQTSGGWATIQTLDRSPTDNRNWHTGDPLYAVIAHATAPM